METKQDTKKLSETEQKEKLKELEIELIKARISAAKGGKAKIREIKKAISRTKTILQK